ncbi:MAG: hypothetical protein P8Y24_06430 [Gammaproteobacteria bacterium]
MHHSLNEVTFTPDQVEKLSSLHFINRIDDYMKIVSSIEIKYVNTNIPPRVMLMLDIFYHDNKLDTLRFDLHNYEFGEIVDIAKNIRSNEFILQEVDNFLGGDIVE